MVSQHHAGLTLQCHRQAERLYRSDEQARPNRTGGIFRCCNTARSETWVNLLIAWALISS